MTDVPSLYEFTTDPQLLGLSVSRAQGTLLKTMDGLRLEEDELAIFRQCTGRLLYPATRFDETCGICGARSGKNSRVAAPMACREAVFGGHEKSLGKGEIGVIPLVAQDADGTRTNYGYVREYMTTSPLLKGLVEEEREREIWLTNGIRIVCFACTAKSLRGYSIPAAVMDEVAYYRLDGEAGTDVEIQVSLKRGGVGFAHQRLLKISTPSGRDGLLWSDYSRYYGVDGAPVLVWHAGTSLMNPTITEARLARERDGDARRAAREYDALFADDAEAFLAGSWIEQAVVDGRHELPPLEVA